jgi:hypothetical protein
MKLVKRLSAAVFLLSLCAALAGAADFGLLLDETFEADGAEDTSLTWTQTATPWFSLAVNERFSFYLSLDLSIEYADTTDSMAFTNYDKWRPLFQVGRSQVHWTPALPLLVEAGRVYYEDPLGSIAMGLFDGVKLSLGLGQHTLYFSGLYAGLQHKERAKIVMTEDDFADYADSDNYFAPKRLFFSLFFRTRYLGGFENTLDAGGLGQIDLRNDGAMASGEKLHSQYAALQFSAPLFPGLEITAGGILGIKEQDAGSALSFAGNLSASYAVPGSLTDRLSAAAYVSSGSVGSELRPYFPLTAIAAGEVFTPSIAGLYTVKLAYQVNPLDALYVDIRGVYFWRTTRDIIPGISESIDSDSDNLGLEVYGSSVWAIRSDLSFSLGGGLFFPSGPVKDADTPLMWKIKIAAAVSL